MQRERTALKVMLQLLVEGRDHLELGQLVPLGDLWDAINAGDEPLTEVMRAQFAQARRLWTRRFLPMLLRDHELSEEDAAKVAPSHPYVTDARLVKSLLIAALVPEVGPLRALTVSRLTALNSGIVRAFIPGTERQEVLDKLRRWAAEVGELRVGEDEQDPTVSVVLSGIDTGPILEAARVVDTDGERRRRVRELLAESLQVKDASSLDPWVEVTWRGTRRKLAAVFANVRDPAELPDEMLRAGEEPKLIIDYPWDVDPFSPSDDRGRVLDYRRDRSPEWTAVWLPNFLTSASLQLLGKLVRLDYILTGDTFDRLASHLFFGDRLAVRTQLANEQSAVRERTIAALRQAYGVDPTQPGLVEERLPLGDQFLALDPSLPLQPPVGTSLRACLESLADQLLRHRYPKHPEFTELVSRADLTREVGDLVILSVASASNRVLLDAGQPVGKPEIGRVRDEWELRAQELPSPKVWQEALGRAADMGVVPASRLLSATTVADFGQRIDSGIVGDRAQAVRDLVPRIEAAYARMGIGDPGDRLRTAKAAVALIEELRRRPEHAPEMLAACEVPTTTAALGTSIAQASVVAEELRRMNWDLVRAVGELDVRWKADADALRERLAQGLRADELAVPLVRRLREASAAATDLLARATRVIPPAPSPPPPPPPPRPPKFDRVVAEERLREIRARLRSEARLDLTWQITEWQGDAES